MKQTVPTSGFDSDASGTPASASKVSEAEGIDFSMAEPLEGGGSTCLIYEARWQRRRVFVKRLREKFRMNPLYCAAFDKEYDVGVRLSHRSLPRYLGFFGDHIVMDFVEGQTLATLIGRNDLVLADSARVKGILLQLVDVVEYLHGMNVVHCDIKADNVMVSPYADRPLTLLDLDKAYTSWLDTTGGDPGLYGCRETADGLIDYRGIAGIARTLGRGDVARLCEAPQIDVARLRRRISAGAGAGKRRWLLWGGGAVVIAAAVIALTATLGEPDHKREEKGEMGIVGEMGNMGEGERPETEDRGVVRKPEPVAAEKAAEKDSKKDSEKGAERDADGLTADDRRWLADAVGRHYGALLPLQQQTEAALTDSLLTAADLRRKIRAYALEQERAQGLLLGEVVKHFGLTDTPFEAVKIVALDSGWGEFMRRDARINAAYFEALKDS